jgi:S-adenosylmethionine synthetase
MFGCAFTETDEFMPAPISIAHRILRSLAQARRSTKQSALGPDAKSQVTLQYEARHRLLSQLSTISISSRMTSGNWSVLM